jgi:hypothetical protein
MEDLLSPRQPLDDKPQAWAEPSAATQRRINRFVQQDRSRSGRRNIDFEDIDMTPNRSIGGAAWGIGLVLAGGGLIAGVLYLLNQVI